MSDHNHSLTAEITDENREVLRKEAARTYNAAFDVMDEGKDPLLALELAAASLQLWRQLGGERRLAIGYWLYSRTLIGVKACEAAITAAEQSLYYTSQVAEAPDWLIASSYEGYARALSVAGDSRATEAITHAAELIDAIAVDEDRALIAGQFADLRS